jgi:drug/metabolite transporter (DMT)-like permease
MGAMKTLAATAPAMSFRMWLSFALLSIIWGATWLVIKHQLDDVSPAWSVTWRFLFAGAVMFGYCLIRGKGLRLGPGGHGFAMVVGFTQYVLNFNFVYHAEEHVTSGLVALTFALLILPNAVLSRLFLGTPITRRFLVGGLIGILGVAMMFGRDIIQPGGISGEVLLGLGLALGGLLSVSVANVLTASPQGRAQPLEAGIAWSMLYGTLMNACFAWLLEGPPVFSTSLGYLAGLAYLAIIGSALAFILYYNLIRAMGAGPAAYTAVVVPMVALLLSTLFEAYVWSPLALAGACLALLGLVVALRSR